MFWKRVGTLFVSQDPPQDQDMADTHQCNIEDDTRLRTYRGRVDLEGFRVCIRDKSSYKSPFTIPHEICAKKREAAMAPLDETTIQFR